MKCDGPVMYGRIAARFALVCFGAGQVRLVDIT